MERNWQEEYTKAQEEIKTLKEQLAHANCEWQREKSLRHSLAAEVGREKRRADEAERQLQTSEEMKKVNTLVISSMEQREQKLKMFIQDLIKIDENSFRYEAHERWKDVARRYLHELYGVGS